MNKEWYRTKIQEIADENGGRPPGAELFYSATNTKESSWRHKHWNEWNSWGDALEEFGFPRGKFNVGFDKQTILRQLADLIQSLNPPRYPVQDELRRAKRKGLEIPSEGAIRRQLGEKDAVIRSLIEFCEGKEEFARALTICRNIEPIKQEAPIESQLDEDQSGWGYVYLIRLKDGYKVGMTKAPYQRASTIVKGQPYGGELIHHVWTDDPRGIEAYWMNRFRPKQISRLNATEGEFFDLSQADVRAFLRRKKFM